MRLRRALPFLGVLLLAAPAASQSFELLEDIHSPPAQPSSSSPCGFAQVRDTFLFFAYDQGLLPRPYVTNGTIPGTRLLKDVTVFAPLGHPAAIAALHKGIGLFVAGDGITTLELWVTDGSSSGTRRLQSLQPSPRNRTHVPLVDNGRLAFFELGGDLYRSDGTGAGTFVVSKSAQGSPTEVGQPIVATPVGCFFTAETAAAGRELWFTDGSTNGTHMVVDWTAGAGSTEFEQSGAIAAGLGIAFQIQTDVARKLGVQVYSDGTAQGTIVLNGKAADQNPIRVQHRFWDGKRIWMAGPNAQWANYAWTASLQAGSCQVLRDGNGRRLDGTEFFAYGNRVGFLGYDQVYGNEIWVSDGTPAGTSVLFESQPGPASWRVARVRATRRGLFIQTIEDNEPWRLYWSDGTRQNTQQLANVTAKSFQPPFRPLQLFHAMPDGRVLFAGFAGDASGIEPWVSDGKSTGTYQIAELGAPPAVGSDPRPGSQMGGVLYFAAQDPRYGNELWAVSSRPLGARIFADLAPGTESSRPFTTFAGPNRLWFVARDSYPQPGLFESDGTLVRTRRVADLPANVEASAIRPRAVVASRFYFTAPSPAEGEELYVTGEGAGGTRIVFRTVPGKGDLEFGSFARLGQQLLFTHEKASGPGHALHVLTGSSAVSLTGSAPLPAAAFGALRSFGRRVIFAAEDAQQQRGLWSTDGTQAGTRLLHAGVDRPFVVRDRLFFVRQVQQQYELWVSDGTASGAKRLRVVSGDVEPQLAFGDSMVFLSGSGTTRRLSISDGTVAGTLQLTNFATQAYDFEAVGDRCFFFVAIDAVHGGELWSSDGTAAGTRIVRELQPGSTTGVLARIGSQAGRAVYVGHSPRYGSEPFVASHGAGQTELGQSCGASGARLHASDPVLGQTMRIGGVFSPANTLGLLLLGLPDRQPDALLGSSCFSYLDLGQTIFLVHPFLMNGPRWQVPLPLPNDPVFVDAEFAMQAFYLSATAPLEATQGLHARMGR